MTRGTNKDQNGGYERPRWADRAEHIPHKPNFVDAIPDRLKSLGKVFFPIPRAKKGWSYPHHKDDYRHSWDSEILNAYLEAGSNYGIACAGDLVVIDIDNIEYASDILSNLPQSLHQRTGSGEGVHVFYRVEGFNKGASLKTQEDIHGESNVEVGDIKGHVHSYVVGPGSVHPSGNKYGPLVGDEIKEVSREQIEDVIELFSGDGGEETEVRNWSDIDSSEVHDFYSLSARDVRPDMKQGSRYSNPFHGSSTGTNFMLNEGGDTFVCWRCDHGPSDGCVLAGVHYLAAKRLKGEYANYHCEQIRNNWHDDPTLHTHAWVQAVEDGLTDPYDPPYTVVRGFAEILGAELEDDYMSPSEFNSYKERLKIRAELNLRRQQ